MSDTAPITVITNRIITLLEGAEDTFFARQIKPGNRFSKLSGVKWPVTPPPASRNLPRFIIDCPKVSTPVRNQMKTFCNVKSASGDIVVRDRFDFLFTVIYEGVDRAIGNGLEYFISGILRNDPRLGLTTPLIAESGALGCNFSEESNEQTTGGTLRLVQRITFPVTIELHRADLQAAAAYAGAT